MVKKAFGLLIGIIWTLSASGQTNENPERLLRQRLPDWFNHSFNKVKLHTSYKISDYINPFYLQGDFNGDEELDIAVAIEDKGTKKKGFVIIHAITEDYYIIGAGKAFGNGGDDFNWMDIWKVNRDTEVHEVTYDENSEIKGTSPVQLKNIGIAVEKSESAGGLISWDGQQYIWTQVGD